jgi:hypothetical protein
MWFVDLEAGRPAVAEEAAYFESLLGGEVTRLELVQSLGVPGRRVFIFRVAKEPGAPSPGQRVGSG